MFTLLAISLSDFPESCGDSTYEGPAVVENPTYLDKRCITFTNLENTDMISTQNFTQLEWIYLPDTLKVDYITFSGKRSLKTAILPKVTIIEFMAFSECTSLSDIQIPMVKEISNQAFMNTNLSEVNAPLVQKICNHAFFNTTNLKKIRIPAIRNMEKSEFEGCYGLIDIDLSNIESLSLSSFAQCTSLKSISLPNAIKITGYPNTMHSLEEIVAPKAISVTIDLSIDTPNLKRLIFPKAIYGSIDFPYSIEEVDISSSVSMDTFQNRRKLRTVKIDNVEEIYSFANCTSLTKIIAPKARKIYSSAFENCASLVDAFFPMATKVQSCCFKGCTALSLVVMNPAELYESTFERCESIEELILPSVHSLKGDFVFRGMKNLRILDISGIVSANYHVNIFEGCESLQEVRLGCTAPTHFEDGAFNVSIHVVNITLPDTLLHDCGNNYLSECKALNGSLYFKGGYLMPELPTDNTLMYVLIGVGTAVIVATVVAVITLIMIRKKLPKKLHSEPLL